MSQRVADLRRRACVLAGVLALLGGAPRAEGGRLHDPREVHLKEVRQLTFGGENAEAYWSPDGKQLVLQSTHDDFQCDQIFTLDPDRPGELELVSTGMGRTTCAYFAADGKRIIYSSTHERSGMCPPVPDRSRGYVWPLYDAYEIYSVRPDGTDPWKLTENGFYDAEATVCPVDGAVVFTSTRDGDLELYRMDADGSNVKRLTEAAGYDGGAFFSPDCSRIVWRASRPQEGESLDEYRDLLAQGLVRPGKLEIWVARADGSEARQVTYLDAASFAPSWFPDGERILFSTNHAAESPREFDLWAVNADGTGLERITFTPQFDGFPLFSPDGETLVFASNRNQAARGETDVYVARWVNTPPAAAERAADRFMADVDWLADDLREGRGLGTGGLEESADWLQQRFAEIGLEPAVEGGEFKQPFDVQVAVSAGDKTVLRIDGESLPGDAFTPLGFSGQGKASGRIAFAGHGMTSGEHGVDDYAGVEAEGRIVLVRRFTPESGVFESLDVRRRLGDLRHKAWNAREHGARALLVADLPATETEDSDVEEAPFPELQVDLAGDAGLPVLIISRNVARRLMQDSRARVAVEVALDFEVKPAFNIVGVARGRQPGAESVVVGAHYDHLGMGGAHSLAPDVRAPHNGADDNASGTAALLEAARVVSARRDELSRDVWFVAFSAEETGVRGSTEFTRHPPGALRMADIRAMLNMDMVGRLRNNRLAVLGGESAEEWARYVDPACRRARIDCALGGEGYGPSDQTPFYAAGIPVLHFFTGAHGDYHKPSDDTRHINAGGGAQVAQLVGDLALTLGAGEADRLTYRASAPPAPRGDARGYGASLGTIPDYVGPPDGRPGVLLAGVRPGSAAEEAGLARGDILVGLAGREIRDIYDFVYALRASRPGEETVAEVIRSGKKLKLGVVFGKSSRLR